MLSSVVLPAPFGPSSRYPGPIRIEMVDRDQVAAQRDIASSISLTSTTVADDENRDACGEEPDRPR
jgi:hypothetical protein